MRTHHRFAFAQNKKDLLPLQQWSSAGQHFKIVALSIDFEEIDGSQMMLFRKAGDRLQFDRFRMIVRPVEDKGTGEAERVYIDANLSRFPPHAEVIRMHASELLSLSNEFLIGSRHRFKAINLRLRKLIQIIDCRLPGVCADIKNHLDAFSTQPPFNIEAVVDAVRQPRVSNNSAVIDLFDAIFNATFKYA